jgi:hypothetical protein
MTTLRLHLEREEWEPILRLAAELDIPPETIAYSALNRLMLHQDDPALRADIVHTAAWRANNLPLWADAAQEIHAYEGM